MKSGSLLNNQDSTESTSFFLVFVARVAICLFGGWTKKIPHIPPNGALLVMNPMEESVKNHRKQTHGVSRMFDVTTKQCACNQPNTFMYWVGLKSIMFL